MEKTKSKVAKDLPELRYKMAELFTAVQNDEIELSKAKTLTAVASVIVNTFKVEVVNNQIIGNTTGIDFALTEDAAQKNKKQLK